MKLPKGVYAGIRFSSEPSTEQLNGLNAFLDQIADQIANLGAKIVLATDPYVEAMNRWHVRVQVHMRKLAREMVQESKRNRIASIPKVKGVKISKKDRDKAWGCFEDEIFIDHTADEARICEVLETISRGDEFEALRNRAYAEIEQPNPPEQAEGSDSSQSLDDLAQQSGNRRSKAKKSKFDDFK